MTPSLLKITFTAHLFSLRVLFLGIIKKKPAELFRYKIRSLHIPRNAVHCTLQTKSLIDQTRIKKDLVVAEWCSVIKTFYFDVLISNFLRRQFSLTSC